MRGLGGEGGGGFGGWGFTENPRRGLFQDRGGCTSEERPVAQVKSLCSHSLLRIKIRQRLLKEEKQGCSLIALSRAAGR